MINKEERYDFAHFEFIMRGLTELMAQHPEAKNNISLSLHCEVAEILNAYTKIVQQDSTLTDRVIPNYDNKHFEHIWLDLTGLLGVR